MSYDALAESVRLLDGAAPADAPGLSRRVRHVPLAVDRDGDVAATMFLRRGVSGVALLDVHVLTEDRDGWHLLGGGGGPGEDFLGLRPTAGDLGGLAVSSGGGGTARSAPGLFGRRESWISYAELRVARGVAALRVGDRLVPVAASGCAVVVWTRRPPRITALDAAGAALGPVPLDPGRFLPR